MARRAIDQLDEAERESAVRLEQAKIDAFENRPRLIATEGPSSPLPISPGESFKCQHPGCLAASFQTQYLLK